MQTSSKQAEEKRKAKVAAMPKIPCTCGCGTLIAPMTSNYVPVKYVRGHQAKGNTTAKGRIPPNRIGDRPLTDAERQKRHCEKRYAEIALMPKIPCGCGCGTLIAPITTAFKPAQYALGHNPSGLHTRFPKGHKTWNKGVPNTCSKKGEMHPLWKGGRNRLGFTEKLRNQIRQRDSYTCVRCGITQGELPETIQVHHLDHNTKNNDTTNLVCACRPCNRWASFHREQEFINPEIAIRIWDKIAS